MIHTTLNRICSHDPGPTLLTKLLQHLGKDNADDEALGFDVILESCGPDDALWCLRAEPQHAKIWRKFAIWNARAVWRLMVDTRSIAAIHVAERHVRGLASDEEFSDAWAAANDAVSLREMADGHETKQGILRLVASTAARATVLPYASIAAKVAAYECIWIAVFEADEALSKVGFDDGRQSKRLNEMAWERMASEIRKMFESHEAAPSCVATSVGGTD